MPRYLGVDYGQKRVGFAISDFTGSIAMPHATCDVRSLKNAVDITVEQVKAITPPPVKVVVGLPLNMNGTSSEMTNEVRVFVEKLKAVLPAEVITWDERLTTSMVEKMLISADVSRTNRKSVRDKLAAQAILQGYLDSLEYGKGT